MSEKQTKRGLPPLSCPAARILILGSLPGDESLRQQQYYAHPQNQFWRILAAVYDLPAPSTYDERLQLAAENNLAVWDVLASADRSGSLDSAIRNAVPNAFAEFFATHSAIERIAFNGQRAHALFIRYAAREIALSRYEIAVVPSTSPAATRPFNEKVALWRAFLLS